MSLQDLTSFDEVRAVLGVSDNDIEDQTLALPVYWLQLQMDLEGCYPALETIYTGIEAQPVKTPEEQKLANVVQVLSTYLVAKSLLGSSTLFAPKVITDGRASLQRQEPQDDLKDDINATLVGLKARLMAALEALGFPIAPKNQRVYFASAPLAVNPITNL